jgi:hypothetical protein
VRNGGEGIFGHYNTRYGHISVSENQDYLQIGERASSPEVYEVDQHSHGNRLFGQRHCGGNLRGHI